MGSDRGENDLKKASNLLLTTILMSVLVFSLIYFPQVSSRPDTIKIDGDRGDWGGVAPIVVDPSGDEDDNYDLLECYVTNDGSNLYFMIRVSGEIIYVEWNEEWLNMEGRNAEEVDEPPYAVGLDTDQDSNTGIRGEQPQLDIGVDYIITGPFYVNDGLEHYSSAIFKTPSETGVELIGFFSSSFSESVLEFGCPLSAIGHPDAINIVFAGNPFGTDFAPDQSDEETDDYVTYEVYISAPPTRRPPYVGGEFYSSNKLVIFAPYIALTGLFTVVALAIKRRRR
ncbi:MAG: hypothetical protein QW390_01170 [Candidatus Bathyarchaeia archaeon]